MTEQRLAYPHDLINKIGAYLAKKPWDEVAHLIAGLQQPAEVSVELPEQEDARV